MNRKIYKEIAKKYGVSINEVKKEMQAVINKAYVFPTAEAEAVPRKNEIPTIDEFIDYSIKQLKKDRLSNSNK